MNTETELYAPENLELWKLPNSYFGAEWPEYYVFLGRNRDSDCLTESNFECGLKAIGGEQTAEDEDETPLVTVVRESHWAVGWVEWIAIHKTATEALRKADEIAGALSDYPVLDDSDFSEKEQSEADETWKNCFNDSERLAYVRKHRSQFEFYDMAEVFAVIRGKWFNGYASELLY